jgi:hypothetical protein
VLNSIEDRYQVDFVYTDFGRVRHQLLLDKMCVELAKCMRLGSNLSGRIQKIRIGDVVSKDNKSSGTTLLHLVCQQNIGDFRLRPCTILPR